MLSRVLSCRYWCHGLRQVLILVVLGGLLSSCAQPLRTGAAPQQGVTSTPMSSVTAINPELALLPTGTLPATAAAFATVKAQDLTAEADYHATAAAMPSSRPDATWEPVTPMPSPTDEVGIHPCGGPDAPTKDEVLASINCWGYVGNGIRLRLIAGVSTQEVSTGQLRIGGVQVYTSTIDYTDGVLSDVYWAKTYTGWLQITSVQGNVVTLHAENGSTLYFDYMTRQWLSNPNSTPIPATPTPTPASFPSTTILDSFTRADGAVGSDWVGDTPSYSIAGNALHNGGGGPNPLFWNSSFGPAQEVFATISSLDATASEVDLLLKAQDTTPCNLLEVWYQPSRGTVQVWTCHNWGTWTQQGADIPVSFAPGDQFGARAAADGTVTVYKNGTAVGTVTMTNSWPYVANGGRVGVWLLDAPGTVLDDVGGGTLP